ncbi:MAG: PEP-utilizing enzyme [Actinomycetota bacterium]|nr:PEP-utilizing enzyme [Actinomycetota bacterium]
MNARRASDRTTASADALPVVFPLDALERGDLDLAGGKGANLGELVRAGLPIPAGFVVTTPAYELFVAHNRLGETIAWGLYEGGGAAIRAAFEAAPIPPQIEQEVLAAYQQLGREPLAVRSSATAEDLPEAAFAGQQDTFLNIVGVDALLDAVRRCWASLWTDRAIAYRARLGLDRATVKLAVVVQRLVAAEAAGVLFTANPVTGARDEVVIDANPGLGEAVVAGLVTPDHFVLKRRRLGWGGWRIAERRPGLREVIVRARAGGGTEHVEGAATPAAPALPDRALQRLAQLGAAIERHFGAPQDVEWAWANAELFILQARPITALPEPLRRPSRAQRQMAGLVAELLPARPYPLETTTWLPAVYGFLAQFFALLGLAAEPLDQLFIEEDGVVVRLRGRLPVRLTPGILLAPLRLLRLARRYDPARWRADQLLPEARARVRALEARHLRALSWDGLLATVREALAIPAFIWEFRVRYLVRPMLAVGRLRLALALLGRGDRFGTLLFTGVETKTLEANRALEALAARIRSDPTLADTFARHEPAELWAALEAQPTGRAFLAELRAFLDEYGHREAGGTLQVLQPTWKDAPEVALGVLRGLARTEPRPQAGQPAWEVARDEVLAHPLLRLPPVRSKFLELLEEARYFPQLREDTRFYFMRPLPVLRRTLLEFGRRLADVGVFDAPEDVFHLELGELEAVDVWPPESAGELRARVVRRKARRAELEGTPLVDPRLFGRGEGGGDVLVRGIPGSPGVAEGPARIVRDASEFGTLRSGEVLVAPYTNPAWTPLFERAAAVVVDSGGPASHAAIVAREYGIPAVMATVDGTRRLAHGERVRVEGAAGVVSSASPRTSDGGGER